MPRPFSHTPMLLAKPDCQSSSVICSPDGWNQAISGAMTAYLRGLPEELYALFGTGYLGATAARQWGKIKGVES